MAIPGYQDTMRPLLEATADGQEHRLRDLVDQLGKRLGLTAEELAQQLPSGGQGLFDNRVNWAATYLKKAGLLEAPARARIRITESGRAVLAAGVPRIDRSFLLQYPSFVEFVKPKSAKAPVVPPTDEDSADVRTPRERIDAASRELMEALASDLLTRMKGAPPPFFEALVVDLLAAMGYGGSHAEASEVLGRTGDGGLDGVIRQDPLGLERVYVQAKRWDNTVGAPVVQAFAGSLEGAHATKGVLLTTAGFSQNAHEYVKGIQKRIVLIDGAELVRLMIRHGIGVSTEATIEVKRVDNDYFDGE